MARPVRFNIHPIEADRKDNISLANMPEGYTGEGFFTTQLSNVVGLRYRIHGGDGFAL
jgi:NADH-quinone oxidoreductase subunit B